MSDPGDEHPFERYVIARVGPAESYSIPPSSDVEGMARFLEAHPDWSPMLDENGVQVGVQKGWLQWRS